MKKTISFILAILILACASCAKKEEKSQNGDTSTSADVTSATEASTTEAEVTETTAVETLSSEQIKITELEEKIESLEKRLEKLEELFNLEYKNGEYSFKDGRSIFSDDPEEDDDEEDEIHEEYDDTAVVNAYLTGDSSALTDKKDIELLALAKDVIDAIIKDGMSDYEKELAVHDWITTKISYDDGEMAAIPAVSEYSHTPYGALKYKRAICVGYATTFKLFMDMLRIENRLVHITESGEHAWNLVKLDGEWYHVDTTFDTTDDSGPNHAFLNVTDEIVLAVSYYSENDIYPKATDIKKNYYYLNGTKIESLDMLSTIVKKWYDDGAKSDFGIILNGSFSYSKLKNELEKISGTLKLSDQIVSLSYPCHGEGKTVFSLQLDTEDDEDGEDDESEEESDKDPESTIFPVIYESDVYYYDDL